MKMLDKVGSAFLRVMLCRMKELGLNKSSLAKRMNVSRAYVTKVFSGDVNFSFATAIRFARALQMDFTPMLTPHVEEEDAAVWPGDEGARSAADYSITETLSVVPDPLEVRKMRNKRELEMFNEGC